MRLRPRWAVAKIYYNSWCQQGFAVTWEHSAFTRSTGTLRTGKRGGPHNSAELCSAWTLRLPPRLRSGLRQNRAGSRGLAVTTQARPKSKSTAAGEGARPTRSKARATAGGGGGPPPHPGKNKGHGGRGQTPSPHKLSPHELSPHERILIAVMPAGRRR